jgi:hypothetical protein
MATAEDASAGSGAAAASAGHSRITPQEVEEIYAEMRRTDDDDDEMYGPIVEMDIPTRRADSAPELDDVIVPVTEEREDYHGQPLTVVWWYFVPSAAPYGEMPSIILPVSTIDQDGIEVYLMRCDRGPIRFLPPQETIPDGALSRADVMQGCPAIMARMRELYGQRWPFLVILLDREDSDEIMPAEQVYDCQETVRYIPPWLGAGVYISLIPCGACLDRGVASDTLDPQSIQPEYIDR